MAAAPGLEYGDRAAAFDGEILRTTVGSGVHGIAIEGTDDHDEMGVYVEPPGRALGLEAMLLDDPRDDYVMRTQPEGARSGPGDVDLVIYSLRKYLRLALKGNPTALLPLYAPPESVLVLSPIGRELRDLRSSFLSVGAVRRFLGYMDAQHERMMGGGKRNRVPARPELVEAHGWDTKYGCHALRLAHQGCEIATQGRLTLPLEPRVRQRVLAVKRGEVSQAEVSEEILTVRDAVQGLLDRGHCQVPERADVGRISEWAVSAQRRQWGW